MTQVQQNIATLRAQILADQRTNAKRDALALEIEQAWKKPRKKGAATS